uniref:Protease Do-like PDZ domain-containing protein n=1 Tax=viral metagenome TaxID=1070528 RepID=A0A6C0LS82_9ZZZZ
MSFLDSDKKFESIVAIYGCDVRYDLSWVENYSKEVYQTTGILISYQENEYVLTNRKKIINCQNIFMYQSLYRNDNAHIYKHDLEISFQIPELNLILLCTKGNDKFIFDKNISLSDKISEQKYSSSSFRLDEYFNNSLSKKKKYFCIKSDIVVDYNSICKRNIIYGTSFKKGVIINYKESFSNYHHIFHIPAINHQNFCGINGSLIVDSKFELIGIVDSMNIDNNCYVTPVKTIVKILDDFITFKPNPKLYMGLKSLFFSYKICEKKLIINKDVEVITLDGNKIIEKGDIIVSIDDHFIMINNTNVTIFDERYSNYLPIDTYLILNYSGNRTIKFDINRKNVIMHYDIFGVSLNLFNTKYSDQLFFYPKEIIPYINLKGLIIVQFTHELIMIMKSQNIIIKNNINNNRCLIIDCIDEKIKNGIIKLKKTNQSTRSINLNVIDTVNCKKIYKLSDIKDIIDNDPNFSYQIDFEPLSKIKNSIVI